MNLTENQIKELLDRKSVVLVIPKKEGEESLVQINTRKPLQIIVNHSGLIFEEAVSSSFHKKQIKVKWKLGRDYAVQLKNKSVWYCPECKSIFPPNFKVVLSKETNIRRFKSALRQIKKEKTRITPNHFCIKKPLRFVLTDIKEKKLLDITEKEEFGFESKAKFLEVFYSQHKAKAKESIKLLNYVKENSIKLFCEIMSITENKRIKNRNKFWNPICWLLTVKLKEGENEK